jgi:hypothetical protein
MLKSAQIVFNDQSSLMDCTVRNLTNDGACIQFAAAMLAPERFELTFDNFRSARACHVAWRKIDELGVSFLS